MLRGLHRRVASWVPEGSTCLDACCGTGGLTFELGRRCRLVQGVDLSPKMIARADRLLQRHGVDNVSFLEDDVTRLEGLADGAFDVFTVAMGLHEMPTEARDRALPRLLELCPRGVIVDFAVPMPRNLAGLRNRLIEVAAGRQHYAGFSDYYRRGGLLPLVEACGARVERQRLMDHATLLLLEIRRG